MRDKIIVALDVSDMATALLAIEQTHDYVGWYKIGLELIVSQQASRVVRFAKEHGAKVFLDAKLNDIPTTVGRAVAAVAKDVDMVNVHALCGVDAMKNAVANAGDCKVAAVTILTSLTTANLEQLGFEVSGYHLDEHAMRGQIYKLASLAVEAGVQALICSPREILYLRFMGVKLPLVTPGVRPIWAAANDQKRIMTPAEAIAAGADYLVIGRPIMQPPDGMTRVEAAKRVVEEAMS